MRKAIPTDVHVAMAIWFLATGTDYRTIGHSFGVSNTTVSLQLKHVCSAIVKYLLPSYITFSKEVTLKEVVDGFKNNLGFPSA